MRLIFNAICNRKANRSQPVPAQKPQRCTRRVIPAPPFTWTHFWIRSIKTGNRNNSHLSCQVLGNYFTVAVAAAPTLASLSSPCSCPCVLGQSLECKHPCHSLSPDHIFVCMILQRTANSDDNENIFADRSNIVMHSWNTIVEHAVAKQSRKYA